jgi:hypothetical protein
VREWDGLGEARRARSVPGAQLIRVTAPNVRKNAPHKESSQENLMSKGRQEPSG